MSHVYSLVCVSCGGDVLDVGKIVDLDENGTPRPLGLGGWRDQKSGQWVSGPLLFSALERWLILHRGHEVRVLSEAFLNRVDPEGKLSYIDSVGEIMDRQVVPYPDDEADALNVPQGVADRLSKSGG